MSGSHPIDRILQEHPGLRLISSTATHLFAKDAQNTKWTEYLTENNQKKNVSNGHKKK